MKPVAYITPHPYSQLIGGAFAVGADATLYNVDPQNPLLQPGQAICYGILRGCSKIIRDCVSIGRDYYHIDLGYFGSKHTTGFYRVTRNAPQAIWDGRISDPARWEALKFKKHPWRKGGRNVVFAPISADFARHVKLGADDWCNLALKEIALHTDRPVVTKRKGEGALLESLQDAHCLVTYASNAAVESLFYGVPVIVLGPSAAKPLSWSWSQIESPIYPDSRDALFAFLANNQWTLEEFYNGLAWNALQRDIVTSCITRQGN